MGFTYLSWTGGSLYIKAVSVGVNKAKNLFIHSIPGATTVTDIDNLGTDNKTFNVRGFMDLGSGTLQYNQLDTAINHTTNLTFYDDAYASGGVSVHISNYSCTRTPDYEDAVGGGDKAIYDWPMESGVKIGNRIDYSLSLVETS